MRDIKRRKSSIESTEQITKAMKLVATVKLQKSRAREMCIRDRFGQELWITTTTVGMTIITIVLLILAFAANRAMKLSLIHIFPCLRGKRPWFSMRAEIRERS